MAAKTEIASVETKVEESKSDKFKRLANSRTSKALDAIASIGGLAAKNNYEYTPEQVSKIVTALTAEIAKVSDKFAGKVEAAVGFEL